MTCGVFLDVTVMTDHSEDIHTLSLCGIVVSVFETWSTMNELWFFACWDGLSPQTNPVWIPPWGKSFVDWTNAQSRWALVVTHTYSNNTHAAKLPAHKYTYTHRESGVGMENHYIVITLVFSGGFSINIQRKCCCCCCWVEFDSLHRLYHCKQRVHRRQYELKTIDLNNQPSSGSSRNRRVFKQLPLTCRVNQSLITDKTHLDMGVCLSQYKLCTDTSASFTLMSPRHTHSFMLL